jgi:hypothetical protein
VTDLDDLNPAQRENYFEMGFDQLDADAADDSFREVSHEAIVARHWLATAIGIIRKLDHRIPVEGFTDDEAALYDLIVAGVGPDALVPPRSSVTTAEAGEDGGDVGTGALPPATAAPVPPLPSMHDPAYRPGDTSREAEDAWMDGRF